MTKAELRKLINEEIKKKSPVSMFNVKQMSSLDSTQTKLNSKVSSLLKNAEEVYSGDAWSVYVSEDPYRVFILSHEDDGFIIIS